VDQAQSGADTVSDSGYGTHGDYGSHTHPSFRDSGDKTGRTSSSDIVRIRDFIQQTLGPIDTEAARKLLADCSARAGDKSASVEQIISVIGSKLESARSARNPGWAFAHSGSKVFPLESPVAEPAKHEEQNDHEYWDQILNDPDAPESLKQQARQMRSAGK